MTELDEGPVHDREWEAIVRNGPIVSDDLVVRHRDGILLGKRTNEPAKGEWFAPGGAVLKDETLEAAVHRVARAELDCDVTDERQHGVYEQFYETAEIDDDGKQYVAVSHVVRPTSDDFPPDDQHSALRVFPVPIATDEFHRYVVRYLVDNGARSPRDRPSCGRRYISERYQYVKYLTTSEPTGSNELVDGPSDTTQVSRGGARSRGLTAVEPVNRPLRIRESPPRQLVGLR